ncbi:MAG: TIGR00159 family protein, partial [Acidobacteria bacterium]
MTFDFNSIAEFLRVSHFSVFDLLDIAIVAFIVYRLLLLMRGTRGAQMTYGIIVLLFFYYLTRFLHLAAVQWLLT